VRHRVTLSSRDGLLRASESMCCLGYRVLPIHSLSAYLDSHHYCMPVQYCISVQFWAGGGEFCSSARGGSTQIQKRVKLEQCNSSKLSLFIKKLVLTNQDCVICTVNTQNLHCKSVVD